MHQGLDIVTTPQEFVYSPIKGEVVREARPYADDPRFRGVVIRGTGEWKGYEVKLFYVDGLLCGPVGAGQHVGYAENLTLRYPGITNHIHVEVRLNGVVVAPDGIFAQCF